MLAESPVQLAADAKVQGDARRGAIVFYQPFMSCRKCHQPDEYGQQLGPDLSRWETPPADDYLVDAVLRPSKVIRRGFESLSVVTEQGISVVGLIVQNDELIVLRDPSRPGKLWEFRRAELDDVTENQQSLMPESLVNQLSSRQQFLDLIRYLMAVRDGGPLVARNLEPAPHLYAARPLPEYEQHIDHAGMIADLGPENYRRGQAIYDRLCVNCHGTLEQPGSLPTSLRFGSGRFKNGSDPFTMYQTLTRGFGMMQPQTWMVPQQKYDVIHYIREAYLKPHNTSQYFVVNDAWLGGLPQGNLRGPDPQLSEPWVTMDYGRTLINTYEVGQDGTNFAYKGIAVRLDAGPGGISRGRHWMIFDHDTMRMAAAWSGSQFIDWKGIHFNGQHAIHPHIVGDVAAQNKTGPGWADPDTGSWQDPRLVGRDGRHYGPLPRPWAQYQGMYYHGDRTIIAYRVGNTEVLECPELLTESPRAVFARHLRLGPRAQPLTLQVAQLDPHNDTQTKALPGAVVMGPAEASADVHTATALSFDGHTYAEIDNADALDLTNHDFTISARIKTTAGGSLFAKTGPSEEWVPDGKALFVRDGRLCYDIGWVGVVQSVRQIADGQWHDVALTWAQRSGEATLYVDGQVDARQVLRPKQPRPGQVVRLGYAASDFPAPQSLFKGEMATLQFFDAQLSAEQLNGQSNPPRALAGWSFALEDGLIKNQLGNHYRARVDHVISGSQAVSRFGGRRARRPARADVGDEGGVCAFDHCCRRRSPVAHPVVRGCRRFVRSP